ncbi:MAG: tetratricopeptide repeat protein [Burkholderiales bacterium]
MPDPQRTGLWTTREAYLLAMVCLFVGVVIGYLLRGSAPATQGAPSGGSTMPASEPATVPAQNQSLQSPASLNPTVQPMLDALQADPRNFETLANLGNTYYDHQFYDEAIKYYERALEVRPNEVNVRTDMGTTYYYIGQPQRAIQEFQRSLAISPTHAQTLFNMGIVKSEGLHDNAGAVAAWEKLLKTNPDYPQKERVQQLLAQAKAGK